MSGSGDRISHVYDFETPDNALAFVLYIAASCRVVNHWPAVVLQRCQVRIRDTQSNFLRRLETDAVRLAGRYVGTVQAANSDVE